MKNEYLTRNQIKENTMSKKIRLESLFFWLSALAEVIMCIVHIWGEKWGSDRGEEE